MGEWVKMKKILGVPTASPNSFGEGNRPITSPLGRLWLQSSFLLEIFFKSVLQREIFSIYFYLNGGFGSSFYLILDLIALIFILLISKVSPGGIFALTILSHSK